MGKKYLLRGSGISEEFADKELDQAAVVRYFRTTAADGKNYPVLH